MVWTMMPSALKATRDPQTPFTDVMVLVFGESIATILAVLLSMFSAFHFWLMLQGMTTIEYCEKSKKDSSRQRSQYNRGLLGNICASLGDNPFLWLLPCNNVCGDGITYISEDTPLRLCSNKEVGSPLEKSLTSPRTLQKMELNLGSPIIDNTLMSSKLLGV
jgi:hypothetical protein